MAFVKAVKHESKLRLAIAGPSGSGKTFSALSIAVGLGGPVAVLDTEHGSASKYADLFEFDVMEMESPYHPQNYINAIKEASDAGYKVIVIDSLTHAWSGTGGLLDIVDETAKRSPSKNTYVAWKEGTPIQNKLIDAIIQAPIHVIATMRSKVDYVLETGANGKQTPTKVGMAAIQRDGMEYEFDILLQMTLANDAIVEKTRCSTLTGKVINKPGADLAKILTDWLKGAPPPAKPTQEQLDELDTLGEELYGNQWDASVRAHNIKRLGGTLTADNIKALIGGLDKLKAQRQPVAA